MIDQTGKVAYFRTEYEPEEMIATIDGLLGKAPSLASDVAFLNFGAQPLGDSVTLPITLSNGGVGELFIGRITTSGEEFASNIDHISVPPGGQRTLLVSFAPSNEGARQDSLRMFSNDPVRPVHSIPLQGIGGDGTAADLPPTFDNFAAWPNPFRETTKIRFTLARSRQVEVEVFDITGRRHRRLLPLSSLEAGEQSLRWDGRDEAGRELAAGLYLLRLRGDGLRVTRKLLKLK